MFSSLVHTNNNQLTTFSRIVHSIVLCCFLLYAEATFVMWSLFVFEKADIIMYYQSVEDTSEGFGCMQKFSCAPKDQSQTLSLLNIPPIDSQYLASSLRFEARVACELMYVIPPDHNLPQSPTPETALRPPRV